MDTTVTVIVIVAAAVVVAAVLFYLSKRTRRLRSRFGPEYSRAVQETGSKYRAETKLEKLEKRVEKFSIHPIQPELARRFRDTWTAIQSEFVDDPNTAVGDADHLLAEVMTARGYPVANFEERAAEISVNHAFVVEHYRAGHRIALSHEKGKTSTEDLRQALIHYRALFDDLLGSQDIVRVKAARA